MCEIDKLSALISDDANDYGWHLLCYTSRCDRGFYGKALRVFCQIMALQLEVEPFDIQLALIYRNCSNGDWDTVGGEYFC